jgi:outer membrane protein OmpA-like peptidoglycan-associated protein
MFQACRRIFGLAALVSLLLGEPALAQEVQIFEEAPPLELLRSIMVPESRPGLSRRFVPREAAQPAPLVREPVTAPPDRVTAIPEAAPSRALQPAAPGSQPATTCTILPLSIAAAVATPDVPRSLGFRVNFAPSSDTVPPSAFPFLDRIVELMRDQPRLRLEVAGHTDAFGSEFYNLLLSQRRAASVARYLVQRRGVEMARLEVLGLGESAPLFENGYDPRNRRVQFTRVE